MILGVSHVGVAVGDLDASTQLFTRLLGVAESQRVDARSQGVRASFIPVGNTELELIQPTGEGAVARFLGGRDAALHHICLQTDDTEAELRRLEAAGARLLTPSAQPDAEGPFRTFGWIHHATFGGVLVELVEHRT